VPFIVPNEGGGAGGRFNGIKRHDDVQKHDSQHHKEYLPIYLTSTEFAMTLKLVERALKNHAFMVHFFHHIVRIPLTGLAQQCPL
jgi:hypothetical protein